MFRNKKKDKDFNDIKDVLSKINKELRTLSDEELALVFGGNGTNSWGRY